LLDPALADGEDVTHEVDGGSAHVYQRTPNGLQINPSEHGGSWKIRGTFSKGTLKKTKRGKNATVRISVTGYPSKAAAMADAVSLRDYLEMVGTTAQAKKICCNVSYFERNSLRSNAMFRQEVRRFRNCIDLGSNPYDDDIEGRGASARCGCGSSDTGCQCDLDSSDVGLGCVCNLLEEDCQCDLEEDEVDGGESGGGPTEGSGAWKSTLDADIKRIQREVSAHMAPAKQVGLYTTIVKTLQETLQDGERGSWALLRSHEHFGMPTAELFEGSASTWLLQHTYKRGLITCSFVQGLIRTFKVGDELYGYTVRKVAVHIARECVLRTSPACVLRYWYDYLGGANKGTAGVGVGRFRWSLKGKHKRRWLLDQEDYKRDFTDWMLKKGDTLCVQDAQKYINEVLLKDLTAAQCAASGIELPVAQSTAHAWMKKAGAYSDWFKQSCFTDKHNDPDTLAYRKLYIAERREMQKSEFAWVFLTDAQVQEYEERERLLRAASQGDCASVENAAATGLCAADKIRDFLAAGHRGQYPNVFLKEEGVEGGLDWELTEGGDPGTYYDQDQWLELEDTKKFPRTNHPDSGMTFDADGIPTKPGKAAWLRKEGGRTAPQKKFKLCKYNHTYDECECHKPTLRVGQDESVYHSHAQSRQQWVINGKRSLRPKGSGPGMMWSLFVCHVRRGFGIEMSQLHLAQVNEHRARDKIEPQLVDSPGRRYIFHGKNKDGYWCYTHMEKQARDLVHAFKVLHPHFQLIIEMDWSSGHSKKADGALDSANTGMKFGGKKPPQRASKITSGCFGPAARNKKMWFNKYTRGQRGVNRAGGRTGVWSLTKTSGAVEVSVGVEEGKEQLMVFERPEVRHGTRGGSAAETAPVPPPWYQLDAAPNDQTDDSTKVEKKDKDGSISLVSKVISGYVGAPKGLKQILWERGLWVDGMTRDGPKETDRSITSAIVVLGSCPDFQAQRSAMDELLTHEGCILLMTPKGHPEIAGDGIEFDWGVSKKYFRKHNTCKPKNLTSLCLESFKHVNRDGPNGEKRYYVRRMARQSRRYLAAYESGQVEHPDVLKFMVEHKTHRNILDQETALLERALNGEDMDVAPQRRTNAVSVRQLHPTTRDVVATHASRAAAATAVGAAGGQVISTAVQNGKLCFGYFWECLG
jgi:hypothetical protein